ncbi:MAG: DNA polymerase III subunit delta' [Candidatus Limnocylindrales bacterium]
MSAGFRTRGQPSALAAVGRAVQTERPPHALLLVGPAGVGKATLALDLAAGLLCLAGDPATRPCRDCAACRKVDHGNHPDVHRLAPHGAGGQIQVGDVRVLLAELALLPLEGRWRVALIERAHRLNQDAQNALLKLLEEPPPGVTIVLTAEAESRLLETVVSRCPRLRLGPVDSGVIAQLLEEARLADASRAAALARAAGGRPGVALGLAAAPAQLLVQTRLARRLLDLLAADPGSRLAAAPELLADATELVKAAGSSEFGPMVEETAPDEPEPTRRASPAERRSAALRLIEVWRALARDLAVAGAGGRAAIRQLELLEELEDAGGGLSATALTGFLARLDGLAAAVEGYANPELVVDVLLLGWPAAQPRAA